MNHENWADSSAPPFSTPLPAGSTIELVERNAERMVLFIPAGAKRGRELGCFGILWLAIVSMVTAGFLGGGLPKNGVDLVPMLFLVPFWLIGLGLVYFSMKMRHTRTLLLLEQVRAVLQQTFLGRTTTQEARLTTDEPVTLVESYRQNDVPVDAVCLKGEPKAIKFGTALTDAEKVWLVDRMNEFLGLQAALETEDGRLNLVSTVVAPTTCSECGAALEPGTGDEVQCTFCGHLNRGVVRLLPTGASDTSPPTGEFPSERITIEEQSPAELVFSMRVFENASTRRGAGVVLGGVGLFWNTVVTLVALGTILGGQFNFGSIIMLLFLLPFIGVGLGILSVAAFIMFGRLRVTLDREELTARWGVGLLRYTKRMATDTITHVTVEQSPMAVKQGRRRSHSSGNDTRMALVWADSRWIPLTMLQGVNDARHVAALVRNQLADLGMRVDDRRAAAPASELADDDELDEDEEDGEESV